MSTHITGGPPPASTPSAQNRPVATANSLWLLINEVTPIPDKLRPAANQTLEQLIAKLNANPASLLLGQNGGKAKPITGNSTTTSAGFLNPLADNLLSKTANNSAQLLRLLQASQLFLVRALIGSQPTTFITDNALTPGAQLQARASSTGFQLLTTNNALGKTATSNSGLEATTQPKTLLDLQSINEALRKALPNQKDAAAAIKILTQLNDKLLSNTKTASGQSTNTSSNQKIDQQILSAIQKLSQTPVLPLPHDAQSLKAAINNSGLFSEAKLAQGLTQAQTNYRPASEISEQINKDVKIQLWQLLAQLSPAQSAIPTQAQAPEKLSALGQQLMSLLGFTLSDPNSNLSSKNPVKQLLSELGKQWLAKITVQQLMALSEDPDQQSVKKFSVEIPVRIEQNFVPLALHFNKYWHYEQKDDQASNAHQQSDKKELVWQVALSIDIEKLGTLDARIRFIQQRLQCSLWAEQASTLALVQQEAARLTQAIQKKGLAVEPIRCHSGRMPSPKNQLSQALLDTHA